MSRVVSYKGDCELLALHFRLKHPWILEGTPSPSSFILRTRSSRFEYLILFLYVLNLFINCYMMQRLYRLNDLSFRFWFVRHQWLMLSLFLRLLENCQWCGGSSAIAYLVLWDVVYDYGCIGANFIALVDNPLDVATSCCCCKRIIGTPSTLMANLCSPCVCCCRTNIYILSEIYIVVWSGSVHQSLQRALSWVPVSTNGYLYGILLLMFLFLIFSNYTHLKIFYLCTISLVLLWVTPCYPVGADDIVTGVMCITHT